MYTFKQLSFELSYYINDFIIEQTVRENFKKIVNDISIFVAKKQKANLLSI